MSVFRKDPDVDKTFGINWASYLGALMITASEWELPAGVTESDSDFTTTATSIQLSGGTDGTDYELINRVTLSNNDTEEKTIVIQVREASWELTEDEIVTLAEVARETPAAVRSAVTNLTVNQVTSIRDDLTTWATIRNSFVRLKGGGDGIDFDNERKREAIRQRIRKTLGWTIFSSEIQQGSVSIRTAVVF
jgi:hypothetical protein